MSVRHCLKTIHPSVLQYLPVPMKAPVVLAYGKQLDFTLKQIHSPEYGHKHVKAASVCISASGEQQLSSPSALSSVWLFNSSFADHIDCMQGIVC